jgi:predicted nuclease of predicted toxin-antitoxin system
VKFLLDHDVPEDLTYLLQELGHEFLRLREVLPQEATDSLVLQFAHERGCLLLTCNRDNFIQLATPGSLRHHCHHQAPDACS